MGFYTRRITDKQEKLYKKYKNLSDDEVKVLIDKWIDDYFNWDRNYCLKSHKDKEFHIHINRNTRKAPWVENYEIITIDGGIHYYDDLNFYINDFGRCWLIYQPEHCDEDILYDKSIDEFLEKYLDEE